MSTAKSNICIERNVLGNKSLELMHSESKGKYYVCVRKIESGKVIFEENPFMLISKEDYLVPTALHKKFLSVEDKIVRLAPIINTSSIDACNLNYPQIFSKIATNGFNFKSKGTAMLYYGSFFNHSCDPNVIYYSSKGKMIFKAVRDICVGEELCISYIAFCEDDDHIDRHLLLSNWNFTCGCVKCKTEKLYAVKQYLDSFRSENGRDLDIESVNNLYELIVF